MVAFGSPIRSTASNRDSGEKHDCRTKSTDSRRIRIYESWRMDLGDRMASASIPRRKWFTSRIRIGSTETGRLTIQGLQLCKRFHLSNDAGRYTLLKT